LKDFRGLKVWEKAHQLTLSIYRVTNEFPNEEKYGLASQLRRSAVSIPTNLAEGCGRGSDQELNRFVQVAMGSASEVEYLLLVCHELGYLDSTVHQQLEERTTEVKRMLVSLVRKLNVKDDRGAKRRAACPIMPSTRCAACFASTWNYNRRMPNCIT